jgi:hypothetical protein
MPHSNLRILAYLALALPCFTVVDCATGGVSGMGSGALSSFAHASPAQTVQAGECWEQDGPDGPGYYPCGDGGGGGSIIGPPIRLHRRHGVFVAHPHAANPIYPGAKSGRVGASGAVPSVSRRSVDGSGSGVAGVHPPQPGLQHWAAPVSPGLAGVHGPGEVTGAHVGAAASPSLAGVHPPGSAAVPHIASPASPGLAGGAVGAPHIGAPASPSLGSVHAPVSAAIPHIGAPASPGLAAVHGAGGGVGHR